MRGKVLFLLLFAFGAVHAQEIYESVLQDGQTWRMRFRSYTFPDSDFHYWCENMVLQEDTLVDGIHFRKAYSQIQQATGEYVMKSEKYMIGQKDGVVYQYEEFEEWEEEWEQKYYPIMDFSLNPGDEFSIYLEDPADDEQQIWEIERVKVVAVIDTVLDCSTDKRPRRCLHVQYLLSNRGQDCWVEGIGSLQYGIIGRRAYSFGSRGWLVQCTRGEEMLYFSDSTTYIRKVQEQSSLNNACFDLQGRRLDGPPARSGLYIKDGRKVMVR